MITKFEKFSWNLFGEKKPKIRTAPRLKNPWSVHAFVDEQVKDFPIWTVPEKPYKRRITEYESDILSKYFIDKFSWSLFVDKNGYIILGGGEDEEGGMKYITDDFFDNLESFIKDPEFYMDTRKYNL